MPRRQHWYGGEALCRGAGLGRTVPLPFLIVTWCLHSRESEGFRMRMDRRGGCAKMTQMPLSGVSGRPLPAAPASELQQRGPGAPRVASNTEAMGTAAGLTEADLT